MHNNIQKSRPCTIFEQEAPRCVKSSLQISSDFLKLRKSEEISRSEHARRAIVRIEKQFSAYRCSQTVYRTSVYRVAIEFSSALFSASSELWHLRFYERVTSFSFLIEKENASFRRIDVRENCSSSAAIMANVTRMK